MERMETTEHPEPAPAPEVLTSEEIRILGCLVEKSYTTPEYYPLTVNALVNACNQKSSRDPVVAYDAERVREVLDDLRDKHLAVLVREVGARTMKFKHSFRREFEFSDKEMALLCVLMLRGAQTVGELRSRTERIATFESLADVEETLRELSSGYPRPFVKALPRGRFMHLLAGDVEPPEPETPVRAPRAAPVDPSRLDALEEEVKALQTEVAELRAQLATFREQFE
jgi:uncharacterized protein YceH (UPF0502 family)